MESPDGRSVMGSSTLGAVIVAIAVFAIIATTLVRQIRPVGNNALESWVRHQPVSYSTRALIRTRGAGGNWLGEHEEPIWRAQMVIHISGIELSLVVGIGGEWFLPAEG
jgi:hypothetical protein